MIEAISEADAAAEGLLSQRMDGPGGLWVNTWHWLPGIDPAEMYGSATSAYRALWSNLHTAEGQRWEDDPQAVCLTFRVVAGNIDQVPA